MRKVILSFVVVASFLASCSKDSYDEQKDFTKKSTNESVYESVVLQREQSFWLNSATYLGLNKITRTAIPVILPENTVSFYYVVSTTNDRTPVTNIGLGSQLANLLLDQTGVLGSLVSNISIPAVNTPGRVNVYLLYEEDRDKFLAKEDFNYLLVGSRMGLSNGVIEVQKFLYSSVEEWVKNPRLPKTFYIGLQNPRTANGENVSIEVVAIVKKK